MYKEATIALFPLLSFFSEDIDVGTNSDFLFNFMLLSIVTTTGLLAIFYFVGNFFGGKQDFRKSVGVLGSTQWLIAFGYIASAIICFFSMRFSIALVLLISIINYVLISHTSFQYFDIKDEKKVYKLASVFIAYSVLLWLFIKMMS